MDKINHFSKVPENRTAVDNILRVNHGNQMRLNLMADAKANIMITVASVVFSIAIANLDNELVKWPTSNICILVVFLHYSLQYLQSYQKQIIQKM